MNQRYLRFALWALFTISPIHSSLADLRIVATVPELAAIAKEIGGNKAKVTSLSVHSQDPHFVDARPNLILDLASADLLIAIGLELETGWLPVLQSNCRNSKVQTGAEGYVEAAQFVRLLDVVHGHIDRSQGDIHPGGNPHYLYDPRNAGRIAQGLTEKMAKLDPASESLFRGNLKAFLQTLEARQAKWKAKLGKLSGAKVIAYHKTLPYLADWLGFEVIAHVEPKPGIPPTPGHIVYLLKQGKAAGVILVLQEPYYPSTASEIVATRLGVPFVEFNPRPDFRKGESYIEAIDRLVEALASKLN